MKKFPELNRNDFERFFNRFNRPDTLKSGNNKWIGLNREGKPFTVHVKHGTTRKYSPTLVEAVARDLKVSIEEFKRWYEQN